MGITEQVLSIRSRCFGVARSNREVAPALPAKRNDLKHARFRGCQHRPPHVLERCRRMSPSAKAQTFTDER